MAIKSEQGGSGNGKLLSRVIVRKSDFSASFAQRESRSFEAARGGWATVTFDSGEEKLKPLLRPPGEAQSLQRLQDLDVVDTPKYSRPIVEFGKRTVSSFT